MSEGTIRQFIDYTSASDDNQNDAESIEPILNGENVIAGVGGVVNRPAENLRERSEVIRGVLEDLRYLADADRQLMLGGPGLVTWPGPPAWVGGTGIPTISNNLWIVPALTPGKAGNTPPVASAYGTLQLDSIEVPDGGILCTSMRRSYSGGDQISVEVVADTAFSVAVAADGRTILVTAIAGTTTLLEVKTAINALVDAEATQFVNATYYGAGADADVIVAPQTKQFVAGNYDGEAHLITKANFDAFFAVGAGANALSDGDSLCIWFEYLIDPGTPATKGGRRQSIPENTNTTVLEGAFFNSRLHPERLVNALPVAKVLNNNLIWLNGVAIPPGAVDYSPVSETAWGPGPAWFDPLDLNPATTLGAQITKIITDLGNAAGTGAHKIGAPAITPAAPHEWAVALGVDAALADLLGWLNAHFVGSADKHDADKIVAPTAAGSPYAWAAPGDVAARLAALLGLTNTQADQFGDYARSGVVSLDYGTNPSGLDWVVAGGIYWLNGERITFAGDTVTLTDEATNYVYMDTDKVLKATTSLTVAFLPPRLVLAKVVCTTGAVVSGLDMRRFINRQNSKYYVTVGGDDNYDFVSMEAAVAWVAATRTAGTGEHRPMSIQVCGDIAISATIDLDYPVDIRGAAKSSGADPGILCPAGSYAFNLLAGADESRFSGLNIKVSTTVAGSGFLTTDATIVREVVVENCLLNGGYTGANGVINLDAQSLLWRIQNNTFKGGLGVGGGYIKGGGGDRHLIQGNTFSTTDADHHHIDCSITRSTISGNVFDGGDRAVAVAASYNQIINNRMYNIGGYAIYASGTRMTVTGNYVHAAQAGDDAIYCAGNDCLVENNFVQEWAFGRGIYIGGDNTVVAGNKLYAAADSYTTFGTGIESRGTLNVVRGNYVDMSPGVGVGLGLENAIGIDTGMDEDGAMVSGNVVLNCGQAGFFGAGIVAGRRSTVANNQVRNTRGFAYSFYGGGLVVTGNRAHDHGGDSTMSFDENPSAEQAEDCLITGNWMADPGGSDVCYSFVPGTTPARNRFWNNYSATGMVLGSPSVNGFQSYVNLYEIWAPTAGATYAPGETVIRTHKPENGYVGIMPATWVLPFWESADLYAGIRFYWSDGTTTTKYNQTVDNVTTEREGVFFQKNGVGIVAIQYVIQNDDVSQAFDFGPFLFEGAMV